MSKITLTLKQSSFLFIGSLNLTKGKPTIVDTDKLSVKETKILNRYIKSGGVESDVGLLPVEEIQVDEQIEKVEVIVEDTVTENSEIGKPAEEAKEKQAVAPKQRTSTKKK